MSKSSIESDIAQGLHFIDEATGGVVPPIQPSTTFVRDADYELLRGRGYARDHNPGFEHAENMLCRMEGGADAKLFASGMAAAATVFQSLAPGDRVVCPSVMYWGLRGWLVDFAKTWGLDLVQFDATQDGALEQALDGRPAKLVWIETPCNPTWDVISIAESAKLAHDAGAVLAVDSTVATPVLTQPIVHGADLVMHSATKYLNGHGDVVSGALVTAKEDALWERIGVLRGEGGAIAGSFDAYLLQRGMRTVFLRVRQSSASALAIAKHFENDKRLERVSYPGLESHPGHAIAKTQMSGGFSGMLSFMVNGGAEAALAFIRRLKLFIPATSLGGVESLVEHRYSIEGADSPIPENLVRLSVGIERVEDLIADLDQALG